ncbi:MAG: hypothetical protein ACP5VE_11200 [Chthonomonadales bacterium]
MTCALLFAAPAGAFVQSVAPGYRAAILWDPTLPVAGPSTSLAPWVTALGKEGISVTPLDAAQLADGSAFNIEHFNLLIVPTGPVFPVEARQTLLAFLKAGGDLWTCGGYAFDRPVVREDGRWVFQESVTQHAMAAARDIRRSLVPNGNFARGLDGWQMGSPDACRITDEGPRPGIWAGEVRQDVPGGGARWTYRLDVQPGRRYLVGAVARADRVEGPGFGFLAVYQFNAAGALVKWQDFAHLTGTSMRWNRFEAIIDTAPDAARVEFQAGLYRAKGLFRFTEVTCAAVPREITINAHYGVPEDGLRIEPDQLTLFSPDQPLRGVSLVPAQGSGIAKDCKSSGLVEGYEATAQLRQSGRWRPLVNVLDEYGRFAGTAGSMVYWREGPFKGGTWVLFGVTNRDLFGGQQGEQLLRQIGRLLATGVHLEAVTVGEATYRQGEAARIVVRCINRSQAPRLVRLKMRLVGRGAIGISRELACFQRDLNLAPLHDAQEEFEWNVPAGAPDFVQVSASVHSPGASGGSGSLLDASDTGFCVYSPSVLAGGTRVHFRGNAFYLGASRVPQILFGTDTYANMFLSPSEDPLTWFHDLSLMRDYGLRVFENLQYTPPDYRFTQKQWRQIDGVVQLAQRFGLVYMAGLLVGHDVAVDEDTLRRQAAFCAEFARRYRDVPGLIYYLNGDFQLHLKDTPELRRLWNAFLVERYRSDGALRAAWGAAAPREPLGSIPPAGYSARSWHDQRARDTADFEVYLVRRWVGALTAAIRAVDPIHPITAEYYQRPFGGTDLRLTMDGMDVANIGYFDAPGLDLARLAATLRWNDMSFAGKGINIGEFGVKTHDAWLPERGASGYHIRRTPLQQQELFWWMVHAALAYGAGKIQNWCWADDPDSVFPWGIAWNNPLRPKPVLKLYRNLSVLAAVAGVVKPRADVVFVLPDAFRLGAPQDAAWSALMNAIQCMLALGVPFEIADQKDIARLAALPPKAVFVPLAGSLSSRDVQALMSLASKGTAVYASAPPGGVAWALGDWALRGASEPWPWPVRRTHVGRGALFLCTVPWELLEGRDLFGADAGLVLDLHRNLYLRLARAMGLHTLRRPGPCLSVRHAAWRRRLLAAFPLPCSGARFGSAVRLSVGNLKCVWNPSPKWPCLAVADDRGGLIAATGDGSLIANGRAVARGDTPWMLIAMDGQPLASSRMLAAAVVRGSVLRVRSNVRGLRAFIVEWHRGVLRRVAAVKMRRKEGSYELAMPADELVLLTDGVGEGGGRAPDSFALGSAAHFAILPGGHAP